MGPVVENTVMSAIMWWLLVVGWMSTMFAVSSLLSLHVSVAHSYDVVLRNLAHIGEYAVLTALLWWGLQRYLGRRRRVWLVAALAAALYGLVDEWHQSWMVGHYDVFSTVGIDAFGIAVSYALALRQSSPGMTPTWPCPQCHALQVYRSRRRGRVEWCSRLISLAPFRCDICSHRFWHFTTRGR